MDGNRVYQELGPIWEALLPKVIGKHWPTSRYRCACPDLDYFRLADNPGVGPRDVDKR
jgi:hypothetical protein